MLKCKVFYESIISDLMKRKELLQGFLDSYDDCKSAMTELDEFIDRINKRIASLESPAMTSEEYDEDDESPEIIDNICENPELLKA